jgi:CheY-like chemotaxis protein
VPRPKSPRQAAPAATLNRVVLLVEDDIDVRNAAGDLLESDGLTVIAAGDGREALELLRAGLRPSVIVLDLTMPRMDGWDFRQAQISDRELKDIPVIVATAAGFSAETIRKQFGDVHFLRKPLDPATFLDVVAHCCQSRRRSPPTT